MRARATTPARAEVSALADGEGTPQENAGEVFLSFIDGELSRETARRAALEGRALSGITLGTTLISASIVLAGITSARSLTTAASVLITQAGIAALASAAGGLYGYWPRKSRAATTNALRSLVNNSWSLRPDEARKACAEANIKAIDELREGNTRKGRGVRLAGIAQAYALLMIVCAAMIEIIVR